MPGIVGCYCLFFLESRLQREENEDPLPDVCRMGVLMKRTGLAIFRNNPVNNRKRLVTLNKETNRVYYELDRNAIQKLLEQTQEILLGKRN